MTENHRNDLAARDWRPQDRVEDERLMNLEREQLVTETSRQLPRAALSTRALAGLWAVRIFVVLIFLMVSYAFIDQLR
jgi:hypothetical protein